MKTLKRLSLDQQRRALRGPAGNLLCFQLILPPNQSSDLPPI
jgi:hypothetical protein